MKTLTYNDPNYINNSSLPYMPYSEGTEIQLLKVNPITGQFMLMLRSKPGSTLGIHRHYGTVIGYTVQGAWGYAEHEWIARAGDVVYESAGSVHTLNIEPGEEDTVVFFIIDGALQYLDTEGNTLMIEDWQSALERYHNYCKENNLEIVDLTEF